jgi:hypothetical protein
VALKAAAVAEEKAKLVRLRVRLLTTPMDA